MAITAELSHGTPYKPCTGVGSRSAPHSALQTCWNIAFHFSKLGYTFRSGKAQGCDTYFEVGAVRAGMLPEVYIPQHKRTKDVWDILCSDDMFIEAARIAKDIHPNWAACNAYARSLHTRNIFQVLGKTLTVPSLFVVYWAEEDTRGNVKGGTRTAVVCARQNNIPTYNINIQEQLNAFRELFRGLRQETSRTLSKDNMDNDASTT